MCNDLGYTNIVRKKYNIKGTNKNPFFIDNMSMTVVDYNNEKVTVNIETLTHINTYLVYNIYTLLCKLTRFFSPFKNSDFSPLLPNCNPFKIS